MHNISPVIVDFLRIARSTNAKAELDVITIRGLSLYRY